MTQAKHVSGVNGLLPAMNALGAWKALVVIVALVLCAFWFLLAVYFGVLPSGPGLTTRIGGVAPGDFMFFYPVAVLAGGGDAEGVYDSDVLTATGRAHLGPRIPELVWPYPPTMSLPLAILGQFPPGTALALWIVTGVTALLAISRLILGSWAIGLVVLLFPGTGFGLFTGQFTLHLSFLLGMALLYGTARPVTSGVALGLLTWKPHFAVVPFLALLFRAPRLTATVGLLTAAAMIVVSLMVFGLAPWLIFAEQGFRHSQVVYEEAPITRFITVFGAAFSFGTSPAVAMALHAAGALIAILGGTWLWFHARQLSIRILGVLVASLQITPYALDYDLGFLVLPWLLILRESQDDSVRARGLLLPWLTLTAIIPVTYISMISMRRSVAAPILLALLALLCWQARPDRAIQQSPIAA
jgi:hypothetical protein